MLQVGVAVRLNKLLSEVRQEPFEDLVLVAAYASLEAEEFKAGSPAPTPRGGGTTVKTKTYTVRKKGE